jgi:hypothetical protein
MADRQHTSLSKKLLVSLIDWSCIAVDVVDATAALYSTW